ncbi:MAG: hypothetical protein QOK15_3516 [Nocardioidaceae bacterium]|jgi:hypothetical protein|nr:hypothetical protein [Nocardioidaceae bacterium]
MSTFGCGFEGNRGGVPRKNEVLHPVDQLKPAVAVAGATTRPTVNGQTSVRPAPSFVLIPIFSPSHTSGS